MIGFIHFSFLLLFSLCISGNAVHLTSSWWVINPGGVNLQVLRASWVAFTHVSSATGCVLPHSQCGFQLRIWELQQRGRCCEVHMPLPSGSWPCWYNTDHSSQLVWTHRAWIWPHILAVNLPLPHLHWAGNDQTSWLSWRYKTHGVWERWEIWLWAETCKLEALSDQLHRAKATWMLRDNHQFSGSHSHKVA